MNLKKCFSLLTIGLSLMASSFYAVADIKVTEAWVRLLPPMSKMTAAYMTIQTDKADRLIGASSNIAKVVEIHQSKIDNGVMSMQQVEGINLPENKPVKLKPQGYHLMVMGLFKPLLESESYVFTLEFEKAGLMDIKIPARNP